VTHQRVRSRRDIEVLLDARNEIVDEIVQQMSSAVARRVGHLARHPSQVHSN